MHARHIARDAAPDTGKMAGSCERRWYRLANFREAKLLKRGKPRRASNGYFINLGAVTRSMPSSAAPWVLTRVSGLPDPDTIHRQFGPSL